MRRRFRPAQPDPEHYMYWEERYLGWPCPAMNGLNHLVVAEVRTFLDAEGAPRVIFICQVAGAPGPNHWRREAIAGMPLMRSAHAQRTDVRSGLDCFLFKIFGERMPPADFDLRKTIGRNYLADCRWGGSRAGIRRSYVRRESAKTLPRGTRKIGVFWQQVAAKERRRDERDERDERETSGRDTEA